MCASVHDSSTSQDSRQERPEIITTDAGEQYVCEPDGRLLVVSHTISGYWRIPPGRLYPNNLSVANIIQPYRRGGCTINLTRETFLAESADNYMPDRSAQALKAYTARQQRIIKLGVRRGWTCHYCGIPLCPPDDTVRFFNMYGTGWRESRDGVELGFPYVCWPNADHIIPQSKGGPNFLDNLVLSCTLCNSEKGARSYDEFVDGLWERASVAMGGAA